MVSTRVSGIRSETKPSIIFGESLLFPQTELRFLKHVHDFDNKSQISRKKKKKNPLRGGEKNTRRGDETECKWSRLGEEKGKVDSLCLSLAVFVQNSAKKPAALVTSRCHRDRRAPAN